MKTKRQTIFKVVDERIEKSKISASGNFLQILHRFRNKRVSSVVWFGRKIWNWSWHSLSPNLHSFQLPTQQDWDLLWTYWLISNKRTVQAHTIIRQFLDYGFWYDRSNLTLKDAKNIQCVSSMNPTSDSFTINPRLHRHFCVFSGNYPHIDQMFNISYQILTQHVTIPINKFQPNILQLCEQIINAALNLHLHMPQVFMPTAIKIHYAVMLFALVLEVRTNNL